MSYTSAIAIVIVCAFVAGLASFVVFKFSKIESRRRHHEIGAQVFQLTGVIFAVILAFVFNEVWDQYNTAARAVSAECGALHGAAMLASALPDGQGKAINRAILSYTDEVVHVEWASMYNERRSIQAAHDIRSIIRIAARLRLSNPSDVASQQQILALLSEAHAQRETRTFQLGSGMPDPLWIVLIIFAVALTSFVIAAGIEFPANVIMSSGIAVAIAMILVLVRMLDYPFEGALALSSADFIKLSGQLADLLRLN